MSAFKTFKDLRDMIAAPASVATPVVQYRSEDGILRAYGNTVPADSTSGYAIGCVFQHVDGSGGATLYVNEGSNTVSDFNLVITEDNVSAQSASLMSAANAATLMDTGIPSLYAASYGTAAGRGPSPLIWDDCPWLAYLLDPTLGSTYFNDFTGDNAVLAANQSAADLGNGVAGFTGATAGSTISMNADEPTGVITLNSTTDDEGAGISVLGGLNTAGQITPTASKKFWIEARIKSLNITDAKFGFFCGLAEEGLLVAGTMPTTADALPDKDYIGFHKLAADGDKLDTVHRKAAGAAVTVKADAITLVADTYVKVGIYCDGTTITFYANGVALADTALLATATVPTDEELAFYLMAMNSSDDTSETSIDWVRVAVEY